MAGSHKALEKVIQRSGLGSDYVKSRLYEIRHSLPNRIVASADQTVVGTALATATGLTLNDDVYRYGGNPLIGGDKYLVKGVLLCLATTSNGIKLALDGGTATATTGTRINYKLLTASAVADSEVTTLAGTASATTVVIKVEIDGYIVCSSAGSIALRFAEQANSTGVTVYAGSFLEFTQVLP